MDIRKSVFCFMAASACGFVVAGCAQERSRRVHTEQRAAKAESENAIRCDYEGGYSSGKYALVKKTSIGAACFQTSALDSRYVAEIIDASVFPTQCTVLLTSVLDNTNKFPDNDPDTCDPVKDAFKNLDEIQIDRWNNRDSAPRLTLSVHQVSRKHVYIVPLTEEILVDVEGKKHLIGYSGKYLSWRFDVFIEYVPRTGDWIEKRYLVDVTFDGDTCLKRHEPGPNSVPVDCSTVIGGGGQGNSGGGGEPPPTKQ